MGTRFREYFLSEETMERTFQCFQQFMPNDYNGFLQFHTAINDYFHLFRAHSKTLERLQQLHNGEELTIMPCFMNHVRELFHDSISDNSYTVLYHFYRLVVRVMTKGKMFYLSCVYVLICICYNMFYILLKYYIFKYIFFLFFISEFMFIERFWFFIRLSIIRYCSTI